MAGLRAISAHATAGQAAKWARLADAILADVGADCTHPSGRWQRVPGRPPGRRRPAPAGYPRGAACQDPRSLATLEAVVSDLNRDGYTYRFRHDERPLEEAEGAFLLCGFWLALAAHQIGRDAAGHRQLRAEPGRMRSAGLLTEEFDVGRAPDCEGTPRRRSSTPSCWNAPLACPTRGLRIRGRHT